MQNNKEKTLFSSQHIMPILKELYPPIISISIPKTTPLSSHQAVITPATGTPADGVE